MILGDLIKDYRLKNDYSMDDFAKKCGLSKAYISILERNINPINQKPVVPSLETIKAVSKAIGMDFNDVINILDGNQPVSLVPESDPLDEQLMELLRLATPEQKKAWIALLENLQHKE